MDQDELKDLELLEEKKLKAKYPMGLPNASSVFIQKRLNKGNKYFDSGDYQMAKQAGGKQKVMIGSIIPTLETLKKRKSFIIQTSNLAKE